MPLCFEQQIYYAKLQCEYCIASFFCLTRDSRKRFLSFDAQSIIFEPFCLYGTSADTNFAFPGLRSQLQTI